MIGRYKIITLCGSTRFRDEFIAEQKRLTLEGNIVISVGLFGHSGDDEVWSESTKEMLDDMHLRKIDLADEIFVINKGGYIGSSTRNEIEYGRRTGKVVKYMKALIFILCFYLYTLMAPQSVKGIISDTKIPLMGNRFLTFNAVIRVNQIEVSRDKNVGQDERNLHTPSRVIKYREAPEKVIDFTCYDLPAREPAENTRRWSLVGDINQKQTRPQDKPILITELSAETKSMIS